MFNNYSLPIIFSLNRAALEAKAALYDKLSKDGDLSDSSNDDDDDKPRIMVDFQRKIYEKVRVLRI